MNRVINRGPAVLPNTFATQAIDHLLPNARTEWMDGESHTARLTSTGTVAKKVIAFVRQFESETTQ